MCDSLCGSLGGAAPGARMAAALGPRPTFRELLEELAAVHASEVAAAAMAVSRGDGAADALGRGAVPRAPSAAPQLLGPLPAAAATTPAAARVPELGGAGADASANAHCAGGFPRLPAVGSPTSPGNPPSVEPEPAFLQQASPRPGQGPGQAPGFVRRLTRTGTVNSMLGALSAQPPGQPPLGQYSMPGLQRLNSPAYTGSRHSSKHSYSDALVAGSEEDVSGMSPAASRPWHPTGAAAAALGDASQSHAGRGSFRLSASWAPETEDASTKNVEMGMGMQRSTLWLAMPSSENASEESDVRGDSWLQCFVMHPCSMKRLTWDLSSMCLLIYDIIVIPFVGAFDPKPTSFLANMSMATMLFWTFDVLASLLTGYQRGKQVIMDPYRIALHYLRTWFLLDATIGGLDWALWLYGHSDPTGSAARLGRSLHTLRFVRTLRLVRLLKIKRILQEIQDLINTETSSIIFSVLKIIVGLIVANHIVACSWYAIGKMGEPSDDVTLSWVVANDLDSRSMAYKYSTSLHWSLTQFTPASMEVVPCNVQERIFSVGVLLVAMLTFSSFVSMLTASMAELRRLSIDRSRQFWLLRRYLRDWDVSRPVAIRVQRYLEHVYQEQRRRVQAKDVALLALLSDPLRNELNHETLSQPLMAHPLFASCGKRTRIFSKALHEVGLARGDTAFTCGEKANAMLFVTADGAVRYRRMDMDWVSWSEAPDASGVKWREARYLQEGDWMCEAALWTAWLHLGDATAIRECQAIAIATEAFCTSVQLSTPMWLAVRSYAENFLKVLNELEWDSLTDMLQTVVPASEVMELSGFALDVTSGTISEP